ncbi:hypothetical protein [Natronorarus salvus]|uniref:hypothetical protein n=1 Tax=Natronorarus salvus TaxID=3117733 RepID=UPI002F26AF13
MNISEERVVEVLIWATVVIVAWSASIELATFFLAVMILSLVLAQTRREVET